MNNSSVIFGTWQLKRQLGLGGFGDVHLWQNVETGQNIATKSLKENANLSKDEIAKLKQRWQQESDWMSNLETTYIVRGLNKKVDKQFLAFLTERHAWQPLQPIVMEYCNGGDLRSQLMLVENTNGLTEFEVREILNALRHAIEFLHTKCRIEHRDLKPDNVVIHNVDGRRIYKLTDFGFARTITENTMLKSIVGTRNYVAPEVLDTAEYKNTVDYWSLGIIAFELICGNLPFIPHQSLYEIVTNIRSKHEKCIAITADFPEKKYLFHEKFPAETRMSPIFLSRIEQWLMTALDKNYNTRGTRSSPLSNERVLKFYSELDSILSQKILNVFYLPTLQFYSFEVTPDMTLLEFRDIIKRDIGIENIFCIFPTGHPKPVLSHTYRPIDFFVEEWQDYHNANNNPVMLYITEMQEDYKPPTPEIPFYIKKYLSAKDELPDWLLKFIEQSTHYLLSSEQRYLEAFVSGLKEYALTMEHAILQYDTDNKTSRLQQYYNEFVEMCGRVDQFSMNIQAARQTCPIQNKASNCFFEEWCSRAKKFRDDFTILDGLKAKVNKFYKSGLRRAKEMAINTIFDELKNKDVYKLIDFRRHLETVQKVKINGQERLSVCKTAVYDCLDQRQKLVNNEHLKYAYATITSVQKEFTKLQHIVDKSLTQLSEMRNSLSQNTVDFHTKLFDVFKSTKGQCTYLSQDGVSSFLVNGNGATANSINDLFQYPVQTLIEEATEMMNQMDIDEDVNNIDDLPVTINE